MPFETIYSDQTIIGELIASLLDYARLLDEDLSAASIIRLRVAALKRQLEFEGIEWEMVKVHIVQSFASFPVKFPIHL